MHLKTVEKSENEHWKTKIQFFLDTKNNDGQSEIRIKSYEQILQSLELFLLFITMFSTILLPSKSIPNHAAPLRSTPCTMQLILVLLPNMPAPLLSSAASFHFSPALITPLIPTRRRKKSFSGYSSQQHTVCWSYLFWRNQICYWSWLWFTDWKEDTVGFVSNKDVQFARVILLQLRTRIIIVQDIQVKTLLQDILFFISIFIVKEWLLYFSLCPIWARGEILHKPFMPKLVQLG